MSKWRILLSIFAASALVVAILFATPILGGGSSSVEASENGEFTLYAGQTINAGTGTVINDGDSLNFNIVPAPGGGIGCISVEIYQGTDDLPSNPSPGLFTHHINCEDSALETGEFDFEIPFTPDDWDSPIIIALHADTVGYGGVYVDNTAWACAETDPGDCPNFPGSQWAYYFWYDLD